MRGETCAFVPTMFHELHCLWILNRGFDKGERLAVPLSHINHCLNYIRQGVMCQPDLTLEPDDPVQEVVETKPNLHARAVSVAEHQDMVQLLQEQLRQARDDLSRRQIALDTAKVKMERRRKTEGYMTIAQGSRRGRCKTLSCTRSGSGLQQNQRSMAGDRWACGGPLRDEDEENRIQIRWVD